MASIGSLLQITLSFLEQFVHFLYQWKQQWILQFLCLRHCWKMVPEAYYIGVCPSVSECVSECMSLCVPKTFSTPYLKNHWREFCPILVTDVSGFIVLISFWIKGFGLIWRYEFCLQFTSLSNVKEFWKPIRFRHSHRHQLVVHFVLWHSVVYLTFSNTQHCISVYIYIGVFGLFYQLDLTLQSNRYTSTRLLVKKTSIHRHYGETWRHP